MPDFNRMFYEAKRSSSYISASEAGRCDEAGLFGHFWAYGARVRGRDPKDPAAWAAGEQVDLLPGYHANGMWTVGTHRRSEVETRPNDSLPGTVLQAEFAGRDKKKGSNRWVSTRKHLPPPSVINQFSHLDRDTSSRLVPDLLSWGLGFADARI
jgi:hypothetical protein